MAVAAHPDDIEFVMAGTLLLLGQRGYELHYMNLSSGNCGSATMSAAKTRHVRRRESIAAAKLLGATHHPSIADDLEILYDLKLLRRLAAVIREVNPSILLVPSPEDYMEDHTNTCRLAVTAAFAKGMPNFRTIPKRPAAAGDIALYHAMPHGLRDGLRRPVIPDFLVDTTQVHAQKRAALAAHRSQKEWLDASQGMDSYLIVCDEMSAQVACLAQSAPASATLHHAEGWRRHSHLGFSQIDQDPLSKLLGRHCTAAAKPSEPAPQ